MRKFIIVLAVLALGGCKTNNKEEVRQVIPEIDVSGLGMAVSVEENREYSFTDKKSGYWYARTAQQQHEGMFDGWTVMRHHILTDYTVFVNDIELIRADAVVYPNKIVRNYANATETFSMFDGVEALIVEISPKNENDSISISLVGDIIENKNNEVINNIAVFIPKEYKGKFVGLCTVVPEKLTRNSEKFSASSAAKGFFIYLADSKTELKDLADNLQANYSKLLSEREDRMNELIKSDAFMKSDNSEFDKSFKWITLTMDELVTEQMGHGIYAGLPWFNDYWGRDMFISLPGSNLVIGQFDIAKQVLLSFAKYQLTDEKSKYFGRIPNRARPDDVIYNTTDGTPRFVIEVYDYVKYTGDTELIKEVYPTVLRSIEGSLKNWVDDKGYLTHENADTWMDAKRDGKPFSPRGNRANDIQILWYKQLRAGAFFAAFMGDSTKSDEWSSVADKLKGNFVKDFFSADKTIMADRLTVDGKADFSMRPNQLFAMDFMTDDKRKMELTRNVWEELVYPWGVASLSQKDDYFHPYHHWDDMYFFDESYHNGTVWVWNNGIAIQRMIESGQKNVAYKLMENMQDQVMRSGAVGSLSENFDALPREGGESAEKTGTFLQAWSNAEYLRVWYQSFLGIVPNAVEKNLVISPRIPDKFKELIFSEKLFSGMLKGEYYKNNEAITLQYKFDKIEASVTFNLEGFEDVTLQVSNGDIVSIKINGEESYIEEHRSGAEISRNDLIISDSKVEYQDLSDKVFLGVDFAVPHLNEDSFIFRRKKSGKYNIND
ncbi:MAG: hypothetical protein KAH10_09145 [Flavobacteriales bacterium]|nr:hypothetical protein [Flavobacteriales bacterium]